MGILTELSDEQIESAFDSMRKSASAVESLYKSDPYSYDVITAIINKIDALEKRMQDIESEKPI